MHSLLINLQANMKFGKVNGPSQLTTVLFGLVASTTAQCSHSTNARQSSALKHILRMRLALLISTGLLNGLPLMVLLTCLKLVLIRGCVGLTLPISTTPR